MKKMVTILTAAVMTASTVALSQENIAKASAAYKSSSSYSYSNDYSGIGYNYCTTTSAYKSSSFIATTTLSDYDSSKSSSGIFDSVWGFVKGAARAAWDQAPEIVDYALDTMLEDDYNEQIEEIENSGYGYLKSSAARIKAKSTYEIKKIGKDSIISAWKEYRESKSDKESEMPLETIVVD